MVTQRSDIPAFMARTRNASVGSCPGGPTQVWVRQWPKGAWSTIRRPRGARPVVLAQLVLALLVLPEVSSTKVRFSRWLAMKGWRLAIRIWRRPATSLRLWSGACRSFLCDNPSLHSSRATDRRCPCRPWSAARSAVGSSIARSGRTEIRRSTQSVTPASLPRPGLRASSKRRWQSVAGRAFATDQSSKCRPRHSRASHAWASVECDSQTCVQQRMSGPALILCHIRLEQGSARCGSLPQSGGS